MARARKQIDGSQVTKLAEIGCSALEIATVMDCSVDTLQRRFAANLAKGRQHLAAIPASSESPWWLSWQLL
jgi:DNA-directed RNA polymerase specialized sigma24 family protein